MRRLPERTQEWRVEIDGEKKCRAARAYQNVRYLRLWKPTRTEK